MINEIYSWKMETIFRAFLVDLVLSPDMAYKYLLFLKENFKRIPCETMYFLLCQIRHKVFALPELNSYDNELLMWQFSRDTVDSFAELFSKEQLKPINASSRNKDLVFVVTNQYLGMTHGPTKTALDRCQVLIEKLHKKVIIINTSECLSLVGAIPLLEIVTASYEPGLCSCSLISYESLNIPFFQCENTMPDKSVIELLINLVHKKSLNVL